MAEAPICICVPKPPSANNLWRNVPGMRRPVLSREYVVWKRDAGWTAKMQIVGVERIECRFDVSISVPVSRRDTDNWTKPLLDLCQNIGLVSNDGNMHVVTITPEDRDDCMVRLIPRPDISGVRSPARVNRKIGYVPPAKPSRAKAAALTRMAAVRP